MANTHGRGTNSVIRIRLQEIRNRLSSIITGISGLEASLTTTVETATTSDITGLTGTTSATLKSITFINIAGTLIIDGESFPEGTYSFNNPNGTLNGISYDATGSTNCKILTQN
jgi:hypothetical protein